MTTVLLALLFIVVGIAGVLLVFAWPTIRSVYGIGEPDSATLKFRVRARNDPSLRKVTLYKFQTYTERPNMNPRTWHILGDEETVGNFYPFDILVFCCSPVFRWYSTDKKISYIGTYPKNNVTQFVEVLEEAGAEISIKYEEPKDLGEKYVRHIEPSLKASYLGINHISQYR